MSRLSRLALSKRSVTLLFAAALFVAGISAWGSLKQELLPDIEFPVITVVTPYPGAGSSDVAEQVTKPIENAIGASRGSRSSSRRRPTRSRWSSPSSRSGRNVQGDDRGDPGGARQGEPARTRATPTVQALNINASPVVISSIAATSPDGLEQVATIARTEIVPEIAAIEGVARADLTGGLEDASCVTLDPAKLAAAAISSQQVVGVLGANNLTLPSGQLAADGSKIPVSTIGRLTSVEEIRASSSASAALVVPVATRRIAGASAAPAARRRSPSATSARSSSTRRDDRLRPDQRPAGADPDGLQDVERQHRRGRRRGPGQAGRDRRAPRGRR